MAIKSDFSFGRKYRVGKSSDFQLALARTSSQSVNDGIPSPRKYKAIGGWQCWARQNGLGYPRLGIIVSKKFARRAVDRNRLKRILRELFRQNRVKIPVDYDVIFRLRKIFDSGEKAQFAVEARSLLSKTVA